MNKTFRITARPLLADTESITLDLVLDEAGNIATHDAILGFQGNVNNPGPRCSPFVIYSDGRLDYGHSIEGTDEARYGDIDIYQKPVKEGGRLSLKYGSKVYEFEISRMRPRP
jgi:hypothetical protein